ncbi:hypothetical protein Ancab_010937 [Ancistrocladus abbreviatus]
MDGKRRNLLRILHSGGNQRTDRESFWEEMESQVSLLSEGESGGCPFICISGRHAESSLLWHPLSKVEVTSCTGGIFRQMGSTCRFLEAGTVSVLLSASDLRAKKLIPPGGTCKDKTEYGPKV